MRKHSIVALTLVIFTFVLALATIAMAADPHVGTWKLNVAKSVYKPGPAPKSSTAKLEAQDNGIILVEESVNADGKASRAEFSAKYDGKDYPITGNPDIDTISLKRIDANTWDEVLKKAGKEILRGRNAISKDGKTMNRTVKGKNAQGQDINNVIVYDKQ